MQKTIYCNEYDRLLQWLKEKRMEKKLTMRQLAVRLDVHHSWVGRVELGERRLDVMEFVRYCYALEVDPAEGLACLTQSINP
jgi:transcriptional regulator with XRE-family HTH domain